MVKRPISRLSNGSAKIFTLSRILLVIVSIMNRLEIMFIAALLAAAPILHMAASRQAAEEGYRYYFWVSTLGGPRRLAIVGVNDTSFRVYNLSVGGVSRSLFLEDRVGRMELKLYDGIAPGYYMIES